MKKKMVSIKELAKHADEYIALSKDRSRILASGKELEQLHNKIEEKKLNVQDIIIHYVRPLNVTFSLLCRQ